MLLWTASSKTAVALETGLRSPITFMQWSKSSLQLAIGTAKGDVMLYLHQTSRKVPILGLHSKSIQTGAWSAEGNFALGTAPSYI